MLEKQDELFGSIRNGENKIENKYFGGRKDINENLHFLRPEIPNNVAEDHKRKMEENPNLKVLITIIDEDYTY